MTYKQLQIRLSKATSKREKEKLWCVEMINSILTYHYIPGQEKYPFPSGYSLTYLQDYIDTLGEECVKRLWEEQAQDYKKAQTEWVYTDSEGVSYKACKWADD